MLRTRSKMMVAVAGIVSSLLCYSPAQAASDTTVTELLTPFKVDTWSVNCPAATTKYIHMVVCDTGAGNFNDTDFLAIMVARTPSSLLGKTVLADSPFGGCSSAVRLARPAAPGPM